MTKQQFIETLEIELKRRNISEISDIIEEYEQHFAFKLADGYAEEEIAAKLGDPKGIAAQYDASPAEGKRGKKGHNTDGTGCGRFLLWHILYPYVRLGNRHGGACRCIWSRIHRVTCKYENFCICLASGDAVSLRLSIRRCFCGLNHSFGCWEHIFLWLYPPAYALLLPLP